MRITIPARCVAKIGEKNGTAKYAVVANERLVQVVTNTPEGINGLDDSLLTGAELGINVWVDDSSAFTYNYKRKEK